MNEKFDKNNQRIKHAVAYCANWNVQSYKIFFYYLTRDEEKPSNVGVRQTSYRIRR